jgi:hypothetical protein
MAAFEESRHTADMTGAALLDPYLPPASRRLDVCRLDQLFCIEGRGSEK